MKRSLPYIRNHSFVRNIIKTLIFRGFYAFSKLLITEQKLKTVIFGTNNAILCFGLMRYVSQDQTSFRHEFHAEPFL